MTNKLIIEEKVNKYKEKYNIPNGYVFASVNGKNEMHLLEDVILVSHGNVTLGAYLNKITNKNQALTDLVKILSEKLTKIEKELKGNGTIK